MLAKQHKGVASYPLLAGSATIVVADETLKEVEILAKESHFNAAANRLYYACYYAVSALLVANGFNAQSHAGAKTLLGLHFVSKGLL